MPVAFDNVGPSSAGASTPSSLTLSWSHTVNTGPALVLAAWAFDNDSGSYVAPTSVTCGGTAMTQLAHLAPSGAPTAQFIAVYYLSGVSAGAQTITATTTEGGTTDITGGSLSFTGVTGLGTPVTAQAATASVSTTSTSNMVAAFIGAGGSLSSPNQASRFVINLEGGSGGYLGNAAGQTAAATGGSVTMSWTAGGGGALIAVEVQGAPPPGPGAALPQLMVMRTQAIGRASGRLIRQ